MHEQLLAMPLRQRQLAQELQLLGRQRRARPLDDQRVAVHLKQRVVPRLRQPRRDLGPAIEPGEPAEVDHVGRPVEIADPVVAGREHEAIRADPAAQRHCLDAWALYERLGSPEGELALAQAVVYLALAPKSNATYAAYKAARDLARQSGSQMPPAHILNAPTGLMKEQGYGAGYAYDHDAEDGFSGQDYFPEGMKHPVLYAPVERGFERELKKRVEWFAGLRRKRRGEQAK